MRILIHICLLLSCCSLSAQNEMLHPNIKVINNNIVYQKVFISTQTITTKLIAKQLSRNAYIHNISATDSTLIVADYGPALIDYKKYGYSFFEMAVLANQNFYGKIVIDISNNRYRATVSNIECNDIQTNGFMSTNSDNRISINDIQSHGQPGTTKASHRMFDALDKQFTEQFTLTSQPDVW